MRAASATARGRTSRGGRRRRASSTATLYPMPAYLHTCPHRYAPAHTHTGRGCHLLTRAATLLQVCALLLRAAALAAASALGERRASSATLSRAPRRGAGAADGRGDVCEQSAGLLRGDGVGLHGEHRRQVSGAAISAGVEACGHTSAPPIQRESSNPLAAVETTRKCCLLPLPIRTPRAGLWSSDRAASWWCTAAPPLAS